MSDRLRMNLVAGITTVQIHNGRITDPRYVVSSPEWRLEEHEWQDVPINPPRCECFPYPTNSDQEYDYWRCAFIQENLLNRRDNPGRHSPLAFDVLFYHQERFPGLLGFCVQNMPDIDLIGFALASSDEKYAQTGYQELPTYQGHYCPVSSLVPLEIQKLQREVWTYSSFSDRMPGYFYTFQYLCACIGFRLDPEDYAQVKLYLCWNWH